MKERTWSTGQNLLTSWYWNLISHPLQQIVHIILLYYKYLDTVSEFWCMHVVATNTCIKSLKQFKHLKYVHISWPWCKLYHELLKYEHIQYKRISSATELQGHVILNNVIIICETKASYYCRNIYRMVLIQITCMPHTDCSKVRPCQQSGLGHPLGMLGVQSEALGWGIMEFNPHHVKPN